MSKIKRIDWFNQPSLTTLILFSFLGIIGIFLCLLSMTNFFLESPFKSQYLMMWFLILGCVVSMGKLVSNYFNANITKNKIKK